MPVLNLKTKKLTYFATDQTTLAKAMDLLGDMAGHETDSQAKNDSTTALNAVKHCLEHIKKQRNGKPAEQPAAGKAT